MAREYAEEKLFTQNIDRLLAGEGIQPSIEMNDDLRTALDFARKMTTLRQEPSSQFRSHLKAELLQKLDAQEARAEARGWLARLIRQPVWQAVAVLVFMFIVGGVVWGSGVFNTSRQNVVNAPAPPALTTAAPASSAPSAGSKAPGTSAPAATTAAPTTAAPGPGRYLAASASTNKSAYNPGETVSIHVEWQNVSSQTLTINEFPPILSIMDKSTGQAVYTFHAGANTKTLAPGEKTDYSAPWNQLDEKGKPVMPGTYYLELEEMYYQGRSVPIQLTTPVSFTIY